jgi:hypothetical protein
MSVSALKTGQNKPASFWFGNSLRLWYTFAPLREPDVMQNISRKVAKAPGEDAKKNNPLLLRGIALSATYLCHSNNFHWGTLT